MESFAEIKRSMFPGPKDEADRTSVPKGCIMIIDDDLDIIDALRVLLQPRYRLISCFSFKEARQRLTPEIQIVLLDIKMAGRDGIEAFTLLKEEREDLRIIFHSAFPGSSERAAVVARLSHSGYLTKGEYDLSALLITIEWAMNSPVKEPLFSPK
jgi:DNA-binding NtrC family response regulator